jgi:predicted Zn-dependent protease
MCLNCLSVSRRAMLAGTGALAASLATGTASARIRPQDMVPLIGPGYRPTDEDEVGIWKLMDRVEEEVSGSNLLIKDPGANAYLKDVIGRIGGPAAQDMRIYLARIPEFNAVMFPTGFTVIFSGLLLRMRNEAQLAGVIAHESGHFLRKHQIRQWRDMRRKTDIFSIVAMGAGVAGGAAGFYAGDLVQLAQLGTILTLLKYSRTLESEADAMGLRLIAEEGLRPMAMSETWDQLIGELDASARYRRKRRERRISLFETHPSPDSRRAELKISAAEVTVAGKTYDDRQSQYLRAIGHLRPMLLDDQVKLNDPGASQYIVETLARDGWNGLLRFHEGEIWRLRNRAGDDARAALGYAAAVQYADAPADAWRWHGIMLQKAGRVPEARNAFSRYLAMAPNAPDAPFIRAQLQQ